MRIVHRMNIEQEIDLVDDRPHQPCARQFSRLAWTIEHSRCPNAIEVFIDEAGGMGEHRIK